MSLWCFCFLFLFLGFYCFFQSLRNWKTSDPKPACLQAIRVFCDWQETLAAGLVPEVALWEALKQLHSPWKELGFEGLSALRVRGAALLPTLKRLHTLAENYSHSLDEARVQSSQAKVQAIACCALSPFLGIALYISLPGVAQQVIAWLLACFLSWLLMLLGAFWLLALSRSASWGGLQPQHRVWILSAQCALERWLAMVRVGEPPDLAWNALCAFLDQMSPSLMIAWGHSLWQEPSLEQWPEAEKKIVSVGISIKKSIHCSLMEGRPCADRIETVLASLQQEYKAQVARQIALLPTRSLQPLFFCIAPALLSLLFFGLWLTTQEIMIGSE